MKTSIIRIRMFKHSYTYEDYQGKQYNNTKLIYYTSLYRNEFFNQDIINLYAQLWDIECSYNTLKTDYEWKQFNSASC